MEKSKVYFTTFKTTGSENLLQKLHRLMKQAGFESSDSIKMMDYMAEYITMQNNPQYYN